MASPCLRPRRGWAPCASDLTAPLLSTTPKSRRILCQNLWWMSTFQGYRLWDSSHPSQRRIQDWIQLVLENVMHLVTCGHPGAASSRCVSHLTRHWTLGSWFGKPSGWSRDQTGTLCGWGPATQRYPWAFPWCHWGVSPHWDPPWPTPRRQWGYVMVT